MMSYIKEYNVMSISEITRGERENGGRYAHCYYNTQTGTWLAYGMSAYNICHIIKEAGEDNLQSYSSEMDTASAMVGNNTLERVIADRTDVLKSDSYVRIEASDFDIELYNRWVEHLKQQSEGKKRMWVDTPVSDELPKCGIIKNNMSWVSRCSKRLLDAIFAVLAMIIFSPLYVVILILVRMEDGGPAIFKQERIGLHGKPFYIYKFRSMRIDAEKNGPQLSHSGGDADPRLTKIGRFIRAHHIDELPQLWNVLIGDMAFVGPRPERKYYIDKIMEYDKRYESLYQIRPGVTSYATLYNGYTDTLEKMLRRLEFDLYYLKNSSAWLDIKILFNTFLSIVFGKKF